ncbi:MAG TPA: hypothetical protein DCY79_19550 [Planctomycetaceae bacterium]|nr:hypothetical protein [Blastopirellula sp.]HAY82005.1 hypothetical protein [Planctomycetaceae bacterium]
MTLSERGNTLFRYFSGLAEYVFQSELGIADPPLTDYLSDLMYRFVRVDRMHRVRNAIGQPAKYVSDMLVEADQRIGDAKRDVHRHIGDFTLYWAGLFPESLQTEGEGASLDQFTNYCVHGKRAYLIASTILTEEEDAPGEVLERLGTQFEMCAYGLREVRREMERRDDDEGRSILLLN